MTLIVTSKDCDRFSIGVEVWIEFRDEPSFGILCSNKYKDVTGDVYDILLHGYDRVRQVSARIVHPASEGPNTD